MDAVVGAVDALPPYQYEIVYRLICEDLTAHELSQIWPFYSYVKDLQNPTLAVVNSLRPLVKRGWIRKRDPASPVYTATQHAREAVCW